MSPISQHSITATIVLKYIFGAIALGLLAAYIIFQARLFIAGPQITLYNEPSRVSNEQVVTLSGNAQNITEITLNGRPINTDEEGHFTEDIVLENGYTVVSLRARDRYDRKTELTRSFVYTPLSLYVN